MKKCCPVKCCRVFQRYTNKRYYKRASLQNETYDFRLTLGLTRKYGTSRPQRQPRSERPKSAYERPSPAPPPNLSPPTWQSTFVTPTGSSKRTPSLRQTSTNLLTPSHWSSRGQLLSDKCLRRGWWLLTARQPETMIQTGPRTIFTSHSLKSTFNASEVGAVQSMSRQNHRQICVP